MIDVLDIVNRIENAIYFTEDTNVNDLLRDAVDEIERLRAWNAEIALNARHFAEVLREIAEHPTGGVGCNPEVFVKAARTALEGK